ncbi:ATP-dependent zinc protease [Litoribacillus peritrichatus]|uniref:ATP-dependent zinc protease n=1 Tax=Litoribacillus peritrichatus TaxID=718191 RepID=A0ABP7NDQ3_9GAMM
MVTRSLSTLFLVSTLAGCATFGQPENQPPACPEPVAQEVKACPEVVAPEPKVVTKEVKVEVLPEAYKSIEDKLVIGQVEHTLVDPSGWTFKSRIDSGATTTSIDARDIKKFERDGKDWVRFNLFDRDTKETFEIEKPVSRVVQIKRHGAGIQERYAIELNLTIGKLSETVEVTLTDRSDFTYPVLIGRNFLIDRAVVDVSAKFIAKTPKKTVKQ